MRHSVHNVLRGGFDYYDSPDVTPINDDQPTPSFDDSIRTTIGIPASVAGRPLPGGARPSGHGPVAQGSISSGKAGVWSGTSPKVGMIPSGIGAALGLADDAARTVSVVAAVVIAAAIGYFVVRTSKKESRRAR